MNFSFFEFTLKFLFAVRRKVIKEEGIGWEMLQEKERENNKEKDALVKYKK